MVDPTNNTTKVLQVDMALHYTSYLLSVYGLIRPKHVAKACEIKYELCFH
jgi:hypothetical protein